MSVGRSYENSDKLSQACIRIHNVVWLFGIIRLHAADVVGSARVQLVHQLVDLHLAALSSRSDQRLARSAVKQGSDQPPRAG